MKEIPKSPQRQGKGSLLSPDTGTITMMLTLQLCAFTHHSQEQGGLLLSQNTPVPGRSVSPSHSQEVRISQCSFGTNILILSPACIWKLCIIPFHTSPISELHLKGCTYPFHILLMTGTKEATGLRPATIYILMTHRAVFPFLMDSGKLVLWSWRIQWTLWEHSFFTPWPTQPSVCPSPLWSPCF